jgi:hypothetical protein
MYLSTGHRLPDFRRPAGASTTEPPGSWILAPDSFLFVAFPYRDVLKVDRF